MSKVQLNIHRKDGVRVVLQNVDDYLQDNDMLWVFMFDNQVHQYAIHTDSIDYIDVWDMKYE